MKVLMTPEQFTQIPKAEPFGPIPKVEGAVDPSKLSVQVYQQTPCICYQDIPIWRTALPLRSIDVFLYDPTITREEDDSPGEPYTLMCVDDFQDVYTFGCWNTLEEAQEWLNNPKSLY